MPQKSFIYKIKTSRSLFILEFDEIWVRQNGYTLFEFDRSVLMGTAWLNGNIMDAAQRIIADSIGSLHQSVLYCRKPEKFSPVDCDHLQLVHNGKDHWILTRSANGQLQIFDSLRKTKQNAATLEAIRCIYALHRTNGAGFTAGLMNVQRQTDEINCGAFAIAYAADILSGQSPVNSTYDTTKLRPHLLKCFEDGKLIPFPKISSNGARLKKVIEIIDVITF